MVVVSFKLTTSQAYQTAQLPQSFWTSCLNLKCSIDKLDPTFEN